MHALRTLRTGRTGGTCGTLCTRFARVAFRTLRTRGARGTRRTGGTLRTLFAGVALRSLHALYALRTLFALRTRGTRGTRGSRFALRTAFALRAGRTLQRSLIIPRGAALAPRINVAGRGGSYHIRITGGTGARQIGHIFKCVFDREGSPIRAGVALVAFRTLHALRTCGARGTRGAAFTLRTLHALCALPAGGTRGTLRTAFALRSLRTCGTRGARGTGRTLRTAFALHALRTGGTGRAGRTLQTLHPLRTLRTARAGGSAFDKHIPMRAIRIRRHIRSVDRLHANICGAVVLNDIIFVIFVIVNPCAHEIEPRTLGTGGTGRTGGTRGTRRTDHHLRPDARIRRRNAYRLGFTCVNISRALIHNIIVVAVLQSRGILPAEIPSEFINLLLQICNVIRVDENLLGHAVCFVRIDENHCLISL